MIIVIVVGVVIIMAVVVFRVSAKDDVDQQMAEALDEGLQRFLSRRSSIPVSSSSVREYRALRLGEVRRHFDAQTSATITGWMTHDLGFRGWGGGLGVGGAGLGLAKVGLAGTSNVNLTLSGTTRDDMLGDGFIAVFERDSGGGIDTIRVMVPSEQATRELVLAVLQDSANRLTTAGDGERLLWPKSDALFRRRLAELLSYRNEVSYVSDRLNAILRMPPESRPSVSVYGQPLSDHAILGAAIEISGEEAIYPLFPVRLCQEVPKMINKLCAAVYLAE